MVERRLVYSKVMDLANLFRYKNSWTSQSSKQAIQAIWQWYRNVENAHSEIIAGNLHARREIAYWLYYSLYTHTPIMQKSLVRTGKITSWIDFPCKAKQDNEYITCQQHPAPAISSHYKIKWVLAFHSVNLDPAICRFPQNISTFPVY